MSWASVTRKLRLVTAIVMPVASHSWNAGADCGKRNLAGTHTIGTESSMASASGVTTLVAAGPEVTMHTPGLPVAWAYPRPCGRRPARDARARGGSTNQGSGRRPAGSRRRAGRTSRRHPRTRGFSPVLRHRCWGWSWPRDGFPDVGRRATDKNYRPRQDRSKMTTTSRCGEVEAHDRVGWRGGTCARGLLLRGGRRRCSRRPV